ncbi:MULTISPECIES: hypothetical protein [Reichenbachiella]|uniref:hypothetical protein n=1 Tax=Reichenbachiella TaxID=156993 RepID=UPI000E6C5AAB|nr:MULTISPECIES: hypothetical protein [Reichenbachiella]MBU2914089.1 hypothetical protein [Reichenbachiella agariperforans]RJE74008.1 hypothetical protein BGP76_12465 [Reichenbachiella sp. MSK19-1]
MNMDKDNRINEIMNSLEGIQRAKAPAGGFAQIQQRLVNDHQANVTQAKSGFGWMKVAAVVAMVISMNIWAVSNYFDSYSAGTNNTDGYSQLITDFNLYGDE